MANLNFLHCNDCGLAFGFDSEVEALWRKSHKHFFCPNGHDLYYPDKTPQELEIEKLHKEVAELKAKLATASEELEKQTKLASELLAELELWKPSSTNETPAE